MPRRRAESYLEEPADSTNDRDNKIDLEALQVAHYAVKENLSYEAISQRTGLSRATVARRLQHAKAMGWLIEQPVLVVPKDLEEDLREGLFDLELQKKLLNRLAGYGVRDVYVVSDKEVPAAGDYQVIRRIGQCAAERLSRALTGRGGVVGINWGHATRWAIQQIPRPQSSSRGLVFVPLMGNFSVDESKEKEYEEVWYCSANRLTRVACEIFQAGAPQRLTTPAIIPRCFMPLSTDAKELARREEQLKTIWIFIEEDLSYQRIFGKGHHNGKPKSAGLIDEMDTVITGMSALEPNSALAAVAKLVTVQDLRVLRRSYLGDLGGHPLLADSNKLADPDAERLASALSRLVVSAKPTDFQQVAEKARASGDDRKGVFMIGRGEQKHAAFLAACRMRAVNELFTDRGTAARMLESLGE